MFFHVSKNSLKESLEILRNRSCGYSKQPCDCKYGINKPERHCEVTGCPELACASLVIETMTTTEWNAILKRLKKSGVASINDKYFETDKNDKNATIKQLIESVTKADINNTLNFSKIFSDSVEYLVKNGYNHKRLAFEFGTSIDTVLNWEKGLVVPSKTLRKPIYNLLKKLLIASKYMREDKRNK